MKTIVGLGLLVLYGAGTAGCTVSAIRWGLIEYSDGEVLGSRQVPQGGTDVFFCLPGNEVRAFRVPRDWRTDPVRVRRLDDERTIAEREELLVAQRIRLSPEEQTEIKGAPVITLDFEAAIRCDRNTAPKDEPPFDHTSGPLSRSHSLVVARFRNPEGHLLYMLFGYDPERVRWVRLSETFDLGGWKNRIGLALALVPFCLAADAARTIDGTLTALSIRPIALGKGAPWSPLLWSEGIFR
jgi:hypothetical protein